MTAREQRLAATMAVLLIAGGSVVVGLKLKQWRERVDDHEHAIEMRTIEAEELMLTEDMWVQRSDWLNSKQPAFTTQGDADLELLETVRSSAGSQQVSLIQNQLTEPTAAAGMKASTMLVEGRGGMAEVMRWLQELQKPETFIQVPKMTLLPNEEDTSEVILQLTLQKWYRLPSA